MVAVTDIIQYIQDEFEKHDIKYIDIKKYNENSIVNYLVNRKYKVKILLENKLNNKQNENLLNICDFVILINPMLIKNVWIIPTTEMTIKENMLFCDNAAKYLNNWDIIPYEITRKISSKYTQEKLLNHLATKAKELHRTPMSNDMIRPTAVTYVQQFGSWNEALEILGYEPNKRRRKKSKINEDKARMNKIVPIKKQSREILKPSSNIKENDISILFNDVEKILKDKLLCANDNLHEYKEIIDAQQSEIENFRNKEKQWTSQLVTLREEIYRLRNK